MKTGWTMNKNWVGLVCGFSSLMARSLWPVNTAEHHLTAAHNVGRADDHIRILCALPQCMLHHHQSQQRLGNGRGAYAHAGVVAAFGHHLGWVARDVD